MLHDTFHQPFAQPLAAKRFEHENVSDVSISCAVGDHARANPIGLPVYKVYLDFVLALPRAISTRHKYLSRRQNPFSVSTSHVHLYIVLRTLGTVEREADNIKDP